MRLLDTIGNKAKAASDAVKSHINGPEPIFVITEENVATIFKNITKRSPSPEEMVTLREVLKDNNQIEQVVEIAVRNVVQKFTPVLAEPVS